MGSSSTLAGLSIPSIRMRSKKIPICKQMRRDGENICVNTKVMASRLALNLVAPYVTEDCREPIDESRHFRIVSRLIEVCGNTDDTTCVKRNVDRITKTCQTVHAEHLMDTQNLSESQFRAKYKTSKRSAFFNFQGRVNELTSILRSTGAPSMRSAREQAFSQLSDAWTIPIETVRERYVQSAAAVEMVKAFRGNADVVCTVTFANSECRLVIQKDEFERILVSEVGVDSFLTTFYTTSDIPRFAYKLFTNRFKLSSPTVRGIVESCTYE